MARYPFTFSLSPTYRLIGFNGRNVFQSTKTNITKRYEKSKYILDRNAKKYQKNAGLDKKQPPKWRLHMKIVICIERWLFLFFGFYSSFVLVYKGMYVILSDFHIVLHRLDLIKWFLHVFLVLLFDEIFKSQ